MSEKGDCIKVAVRIRPLVTHEKDQGSKICVTAAKEEPQVWIKDGHGSAFTFNYVFDLDSTQEDVYEAAINPLVKKLFQGFNVTILAYGQTGSGKTHTMGSNCVGDIVEEDAGIIYRAVTEIFDRVKTNSDWSFKITASFMELYMENLFDLLSPLRSAVDIREDCKKICIPGLTEVPVESADATIQCLKNGSLGRMTAATAMNQNSSRSHAIFTLTIQQQKVGSPSTATTAKFHLVDLAGSERCKKTQAVGERFKEGVTINAGLLALGNVISVLGEGGKQVPSYRSSKLTRLLQDSLGGNSHTLMIACISPADTNLSETISTLRYADRARKIKNRPIVNQDPKCAEIAALKAKVEELQLQLLEGGGANGCGNPETVHILEQALEAAENKAKALEARNRILTNSYNNAISELTVAQEKLMCHEAALDRQKEFVADLDGSVTQNLKLLDNAKSYEESMHFVTVLKKSFCEKISALYEDQMKTELEQRNLKVDNEVPFVDNEMDEEMTEDIRQMDVKQEEHVNKQSMLQRELYELERQLLATAEMHDQFTKEKHTVHDLEQRSLLHKEKYEKQIASLEKEKNELMANIKALQAANKEAEVKAKQSELAKKNAQIEELQRKLADHAKVVRQKEASEKKVEMLTGEIRQIKQAKVKLIKQMSQESAQWKAWRLEREREARKFREQDKKRQNEMQKKENLHQKQMNVTKRKLEEVNAANKRLRDAMAKQKSVRVQRELKGNKEQIQEFVAREVEVLASTVEAERSLQTLLEHRAALNHELESMRRLTMDSARAKELAALEEEIELRSTQIADFQQKILDAEQESKSKRHWDTIGTMSDAKTALAHSMRLAAEIKKEALEKESLVHEVKSIQEATLREKEQLIKKLLAEKEQQAREIAKEREQYRLELVKVTKEHQEALNDLRPILDVVAGHNESQRLENEALQSKLDTILSVTMTPKFKQKMIKDSKDLDALDLSMDHEDMDDPNDPDWRKTPVFKKIARVKRSIAPFAGKKRSLGDRANERNEFWRCGCHSQCDTKRCICKKKNVACGENCSCDPMKCNFKLSKSGNSEDLGISGLNATFVLDSNSVNWPSKRRRSSSFSSFDQSNV